MSLNDRLSSHRTARLSSPLLHAAVLVFVCCTMLFLGAPLAQAQSAGTGALTGTVTDASGASVPNVTVTATNTATNQVRTMTTGSDGVYKFSLIPPGTYTLKFGAANFKTAQVTGVTVAVTETQTVDKVLEIGAVTEKVTVEANVETIQTESSTLGTTVSGNTITSLPLANRNYTQILSLSAGANVAVNNATSLGKGTQDMSVNGMDPGMNNYQMDGVAINNIANSGSSNDGTIYTGIAVPSPDAIQEFKVQTSTYDASYGRNPGGNVNVVTKSGTNTFHGSAFEFLRNSVLNADDFFYVKSPGHAHQVLNQNQFGGTIGGPIKKDKLFFFFSYQGTRSKNGVTGSAKTFGGQFVPFSTARGTCPAAVSAPDLSPITICDSTAQTFAAGVGTTNIEALRVMQLKNPDGSYYIPSPQTNSSCFSNDPADPLARWTCNFNVPAIYNENQYLANGDYTINSKQTLAMRYFYTHNPQLDTLGQGGGWLPGTPVTAIWGNQTAVLKLTSLVTNNFVNEARISFQRNVAIGTQAMPTFNGTPTLAATLGIKPLNTGNTPPPMFNIFDGYNLFGSLFPIDGPTNQIQVADNISWSHGKHSLRAGFEYEDTRWPLKDRGLELGFTLLPGIGGILSGGSGPAFSFGCLFCVKGIDGEKEGIIHSYQVPNMNGYVLDDWKIDSRLTLNIGVRWEFDGLISDRLGRLTQVWLNRMAANVDVPTSVGAALGDPAAVQQYVVPSNFVSHFGQPPTGVMVASNQHSVSGHAPYSNFGPRIGFAWQPLTGGKLALRGGFGIFYDRVGLDRVVHAFQQGNPYALTYDYGFLSPRNFAASLADPYPAIQLTPLPSNPSLGFAPRFSNYLTRADSGLNTPYVSSAIHTPLIREYNLNLQYEFSRGWVMELGYVGSSGINLTDQGHTHNGAQLATPTNSLSYLCVASLCNTGGLFGNTNFRVPYLGYEPVGLQATEWNGISNYNSLQATVRHQFSHGLMMQAAYTWSKDLTDILGTTADVNDPANMRGQYGPAWFNRPQRLIVNYSYDLPFGKDTMGIAGKLRSGWQISGVTVLQSGDPLTFIDRGAGTAYGTNQGALFLGGVGTAQFCPGMGNGNVLGTGSVYSRVVSHQYFNPAAFQAGVCEPDPVPYGDATALGWGNSGIGIVLGPGQFNWDISLLKTTKLMEGLSMQFRTDFYNAFNHPQFTDPGQSVGGSPSLVDITSPTYGRITNTSVNPRLIQFGLRFLF